MGNLKLILIFCSVAVFVSCSKELIEENEYVEDLFVAPDTPIITGHNDLIVKWNGIDRQVLINIPDGYDESNLHSLIILLHGGGGNAFAMVSGHSNFVTLAETENIVLVAPQGTLTQSGRGYKWNSWNDNNTTDDIGFLEALIQWLTEELSIDENRRFMAGFSNGAAMTQRFAAEKPEMILGTAAICHSTGYTYIPSEGGIRYELPVPIGPVSMLLIRGGSDLIIPPTEAPNPLGKVYDTPLQQQNYWLNADNCTATNFEEGTTEPGVHFRKFEMCENSSQVHSWFSESLEHTWPNSPTEFHIDVNQLVMDFFLSQ